MKDLLDIFIHKVKQPMNNLNLIIYTLKEEDELDRADLDLSEQMIHSMNYIIENYRPYLKAYGKEMSSSQLAPYFDNLVAEKTIDGVLLPLVERLKEAFLGIHFRVQKIPGLSKGNHVNQKWLESDLDVVNTIVCDYLEGSIHFEADQVIIKL